jgi:hypothetical protein
MTQHTPGPWIVAGEWDVESPEHGQVATCETHEDARLIAAAPDLLAALEHVVGFFDQLKPEDIARYRAAIANATAGTS